MLTSCSRQTEQRASGQLNDSCGATSSRAAGINHPAFFELGAARQMMLLSTAAVNALNISVEGGRTWLIKTAARRPELRALRPEPGTSPQLFQKSFHKSPEKPKGFSTPSAHTAKAKSGPQTEKSCKSRRRVPLSLLSDSRI
jgi:hypothetical protein